MARDRFVTTILLDEETRAIARTLPNLSWFVRDALRSHRDTTDRKILEDHPRYDIALGCCSPFLPQGICGICWPMGAPTRKDWLDFTRMKRAGATSGFGEHDQKPISHETLWPVPTKFEDRGQFLPGHKPEEIQPRKGILRRFWNWFY